MEINHRKEIAKFYSGTMEPEQSLGKSGNRTGISIEKSNLWEIYSLSSDNTLDGCPHSSTKRSGKKLTIPWIALSNALRTCGSLHFITRSNRSHSSGFSIYVFSGNYILNEAIGSELQNTSPSVEALLCQFICEFCVVVDEYDAFVDDLYQGFVYNLGPIVSLTISSAQLY